MRFKIDEHFPLEATDALRDAGHEAHSVHDESLEGAADPTLAAKCLSENRVILTMDLGFADIRTYPPSQFPGIVVFRPPRQDKRTVLALLQQLLPALTPSQVEGHLLIVEEHRIRVRA